MICAILIAVLMMVEFRLTLILRLKTAYTVKAQPGYQKLEFQFYLIILMVVVGGGHLVLFH